MSFGERLKKVRLEKDMTLLEVAGKLGKTEATVQRYESGNIKNLKSDVIEELANVLRTSPAYLMGWLDNEQSYVAESSYPYITEPISAGVPQLVESVEELEEIILPDSIMGKYANQENVWIMRTNGESMNKVIPNGCLIAVKSISIENINDGDIVVYRDCYEYAVKRIYRSNDKMIFRPDSTDLTFTDHVVNVDEQLDVVGKVVMYIVNLD